MESVILNNITIDTIDYGFHNFCINKVTIIKNNGYINAYQYCLCHNKNLNDWIEIDQAKEIIEIMFGCFGITRNDLIIVLDNEVPETARGTYVHYMLMSHIAQWANPMFAFKVNELSNNFINRKNKVIVKKPKFSIEQELKQIMIKQDLLLANTKKTQDLEEQIGDIRDNTYLILNNTDMLCGNKY